MSIIQIVFEAMKIISPARYAAPGLRKVRRSDLREFFSPNLDGVSYSV